MSVLENFCCICVKKFENLKNIKETDENNVKYQEKLSICAPDQNWKDDFDICKPCIECLNIAYEFIQKCLNSENLRNEQLNISKTVDESEEDFFKCDNCDKQFKLKRSLKLHLTRIHNDKTVKDINKQENIDDIKNYDNDSYSSEENNCDNFSEDENIKTKKKLNRRKNPLTCEYCGKIFYRRQHYSAHIRSKHTFEKPYKCNLCDAKYTNSHSLLVHKRNHNNEKPFICSYCGKTFVCSGDLYHHSKIHLNKREYKCSLCEKSFNTASILRTHKICMHTDPSDWKYVCTYCSRKFPINSSLVTHLKRHKGVREFTCHICEKQFFDKSELTKHFRCHSNERNFGCNLCPDKFYKNAYGLKKHMKLVHDVGNLKICKPEKRFFCPLCPKVFTFNNKLQRHIFTHTGEKPFKCEMCDKRFLDNYYKKVHLKKKHNVHTDEII